jgi:mRNA interferase YafQ
MPREIIRTSTYKRDIKREMKGRYRHSLESDLMAVYELLVTDQPLPASLHSLSR